MKEMKKLLDSLTDEQKMTFAEILNNSLSNQSYLLEEEEQKSEEQKAKLRGVRKNDIIVNEDFTVNRKISQREDRKVRAKKNKWVDDGSNYGDDRDLETPDYIPTPRNRQKSKKHKVECHVCGKQFSINPKFTYGEYHRCNKCTGG